MRRPANSAAVDAVKELRLRRWARENYVPTSRRNNGWHPIVLAEMEARDREVEAHGMIWSSGFVPLEPGNLDVHAAHETLEQPHFASRRSVANLPEWSIVADDDRI